MENKKAILVVSFGTSYTDSIKSAIEPIEREIGEQHPDHEIRRAFTSPKIVRKLKRRDNISVDNAKEALERLLQEGFSEVIVQPTYVICGYEYDYLKEDVMAYKDKFSSFFFGTPLLTKQEDYINAAKAVYEETKKLANDETAIVFMGHGTEHSANSSYLRLQNVFYDMGLKNYFVGTVESKPDISDLKENLTKAQFKKTVLFPFMIVSGDHANNDMAGDAETSWKSVLKNAGFEVECHLTGIGEYKGIRDIIESRIK